MIIVWIILILVAGFFAYSSGTGFVGVIADIIKTIAWIEVFSYFGILGNWLVIVLIALNVIGLLVRIAHNINEY